MGSETAITHDFVEFQAPRSRARVGRANRLAGAYFVVLGGWAFVAAMHDHPILGGFATFVWLELALATFRVGSIVGGVVYEPELAHRVAPALRALCARAGCAIPTVAIRDDSVRAAAVRRQGKRLVLVLSKRYLQAIDDRALAGLLAHEVIHIARHDLARARARTRIVVIPGAFAAGVLAAVLIGKTIAFPVYLAGVTVAFFVVQIGLSVLNRPAELRADREGAALTGDPAALARALSTAHRLSQETRTRLYGRAPWRWLLSPLSWTLPTHPPMSARLMRLEALTKPGATYEPMT